MSRRYADWDPTWRQVALPEGVYPRGYKLIAKIGIIDSEREWVMGKTAAALDKI
jgi:hypothetical protein